MEGSRGHTGPSRGQQKAAEGSRGQQKAAEGSRGQQRAGQGGSGLMNGQAHRIENRMSLLLSLCGCSLLSPLISQSDLSCLL